MYRYNKLALGVCVVSGVIAGLIYRKESHLDDVGVHASGHVVRIDEESDDDGTSYFPVVEFDAGREHIYTFRSNVSSSGNNDSVGDRIDVIYDPESPGDTAEIDRFTERWMMVTIFGIVSVGALVAARMCGERGTPPPLTSDLPEARAL